MSYDVVLQGFEDGIGIERDCGPEARAPLLTASDRHEPDHHFVHVAVQDGAGDVYGVKVQSEPLTGLMFNRIKKPADGVLDLIVEIAQAADWVILPVDAPTCLVSEAQRHHLPAELAQGPVRRVSSGRRSSRSHPERLNRRPDKILTPNTHRPAVPLRGRERLAMMGGFIIFSEGQAWAVSNAAWRATITPAAELLAPQSEARQNVEQAIKGGIHYLDSRTPARAPAQTSSARSNRFASATPTGSSSGAAAPTPMRWCTASTP
jgi:hypothetical protein